MVQPLSEQLLKRLQARVDAGRFGSVEEAVRIAFDNFELDEKLAVNFGDFPPGELAKLVEAGEQSGRDEGWLTTEQLESNFNAFRQTWLAGRQR